MLRPLNKTLKKLKEDALMVTKTDYTFSSHDDRNTPIHAVKWIGDENNVKAVLQLVHGMQEHIERYSEFAEYLAEKGFAVYGHDHIGHGDSVEKDEDRGRMHTDFPDDTMIDDMLENYRIIKARYPDKPYFILGHSMGSYLLRKFLSVKAADIKGLSGAIIMGTGSEADAAIFAGKALCKLLCTIKGKDAPSPFIAGLMFGGNYKKFDLTGKDPSNSWLSKNVESVKAYMDPANKKDHCEFSLNGYMILLRSTWFDNRMSNIKRMNLDIPVIFVSGDQDPVGAMGAGVKKAYEMFREAGVKDLSIKLYEGDRHEILNELDCETVYNDLYEWMISRCTTS